MPPNPSPQKDIGMARQIVADVGNTEIVIGLYNLADHGLERHWRISTKVPRTEDELRLLLRGLLTDAGEPTTLRRGVIGSVVPAVTQALESVFSTLVEEETFIVSADSNLPIQLDVEEPLSVGADRILNTLAARERFGRDTIAVDLGTATTFDCITADGVFKGGVIAPGVRAGLDWLARSTAKLPKVELVPPKAVIGRRTETCIQSGVFHSAIAAVDGMVGRIKAEWGTDPLVVATGGYATVVGPHCTTVERVEPFLTLDGLDLAGRILADRG